MTFYTEYIAGAGRSWISEVTGFFDVCRRGRCGVQGRRSDPTVDVLNVE